MVVYNCGAFPDQDETVFYNNELQVSGKVVKPKWDVTVNKSECEQDAKIDGDPMGVLGADGNAGWPSVRPKPFAASSPVANRSSPP